MTGSFVATATEDVNGLNIRKFVVSIDGKAWMFQEMTYDAITSSPTSGISDSPISTAYAIIENLGVTIIKIGDY